MAVIVDPVLLDVHDAGDEGGGDGHARLLRTDVGLDNGLRSCRLAIDSHPRQLHKCRQAVERRRIGEGNMSLATIAAVERNEAGIAAALGILKQRFGERLQTGQAIREQHGHTTTYIPTQAPDGVVWPETTEEVQEIVRVCAEHRVPVIAFGIGSSLEGHVNAPGGGISLDTSRMNRVLEVNPQDLDCTVEPGVTREDLNRYLRDTGLFFPIDPGRQCQPRRHGGDAGLGHQRRALRHDARQRAVADRRDGRRASRSRPASAPRRARPATI